MNNCNETECSHNSTYLAGGCTIFDKKLNLKTENQNYKNDELVLGHGNQ